MITIVKNITVYLVTLAILALHVGAMSQNVQNMYFPGIEDDVWETISPVTLGWNTDSLNSLNRFLEKNKTKSFMILVGGKIAVEEYFDGHTATAQWQWNSAGKTLVASTIGIAQQSGKLSINHHVSRYLGPGWTSAPAEKEELITLRHLLTMTSGLSNEQHRVVARNLTYKSDAGQRWAYHNVFQLLMNVVAEAVDTDFETYFNNFLCDKIGMTGYWRNGPIFKIFHSNTRSMARFGLLALNQGKWQNVQVIDNAFFVECMNTSQTLNPAYGYFWWLNGKNAYMLPRGQEKYTGMLIPNAPADMYAAMGAQNQRIYIVPSKNLVIVRMGQASGKRADAEEITQFDISLWSKLNAIMN